MYTESIKKPEWPNRIDKIQKYVSMRFTPGEFYSIAGSSVGETVIPVPVAQCDCLSNCEWTNWQS
jgi:hypothetical protein